MIERISVRMDQIRPSRCQGRADSFLLFFLIRSHFFLVQRLLQFHPLTHGWMVLHLQVQQVRQNILRLLIQETMFGNLAAHRH
jgi:hypothetical protein